MIDSLDRYPRGHKGDSIDYVCERPFRSVSISADGSCYICICEAWLPVSVGNIDSFQRLEDIWLNPVACELQKNIQDKKFTHCAVEHCGIKYHNI